jgi:hypothetical protein
MRYVDGHVTLNQESMQKQWNLFLIAFQAIELFLAVEMQSLLLK